MANEQFYMGKDGFAWFVGVVEDRDDPDQQGRVRVRCLGHHTENIPELPKKMELKLPSMNKIKMPKKDKLKIVK